MIVRYLIAGFVLFLTAVAFVVFLAGVPYGIFLLIRTLHSDINFSYFYIPIFWGILIFIFWIVSFYKLKKRIRNN